MRRSKFQLFDHGVAKPSPSHVVESGLAPRVEASPPPELPTAPPMQSLPEQQISTSSVLASLPPEIPPTSPLPAAEEETAGDGNWSCPSCSFLNSPFVGLCDICETPHPGPPEEEGGSPLPSATEEVAAEAAEFQSDFKLGGRLDSVLRQTRGHKKKDLTEPVTPRGTKSPAAKKQPKPRGGKAGKPAPKPIAGRWYTRNGKKIFKAHYGGNNSKELSGKRAYEAWKKSQGVDVPSESTSKKPTPKRQKQTKAPAKKPAAKRSASRGSGATAGSLDDLLPSIPQPSTSTPPRSTSGLPDAASQSGKRRRVVKGGGSAEPDHPDLTALLQRTPPLGAKKKGIKYFGASLKGASGGEAPVPKSSYYSDEPAHPTGVIDKQWDSGSFATM